MVTEISNPASLQSINPATKVVIAETACTRLEDIPGIVAIARQASVSWRELSVGQRLDFVKRFRDLLSDEKESLSRLITEETGKPFTEAMVSEIFGVLETCQWLESRAKKLLSQKPVPLNPIFFAGKRSYNVYQALGVVAVVSPWNYPFSIPAASILLALIAGNGVVLKPSPKTPLVAAALVTLLEKAGFPKGLVGLVQGDRAECEKLILSGINRIVFTGSVGGGRAIMAIAAQHLIPLTLELGGKHPAMVLPDVDVDQAASGIVWNAFTNAGQACASIDRLYLIKSSEQKEQKLLEKIVERASKLRLGDPSEPNTDVGPLIDGPQLERIQSLLEDAMSKGARVLCGGKSRPELGGYYFEPTIITDLSDEMRILKEEIFGPILPVMILDNVEQAMEKANSSDLGLASSIWTANIAQGEELAGRLQAGIVWLNDGLFSHVCPDAPWGGVKNSGFGRAHSEYELLDMVSIKNVGISGEGIRDWHFPYSEPARGYIKAAIDLLHRRSLGEKIKAIVELLKNKSKM